MPEPAPDADLRRHLRDLVALLALPALWSDRDPADVVGLLLDVLVGMLRLDVAYARLAPVGEGPVLEAARVAGRPDPAGLKAELALALASWMKTAEPVGVVQWPALSGPCRVVRVPLALDGDRGAVVAGSGRPDFPTEREVFLLHTAVNQAAVALRNARLLVALRETNRIKDEFVARERAARTEAEAANRSKDDFLATLSHELRAPLNAILGWTQVLRASPTGGATLDRALETIERNARQQAQLIEDLLDLSRIVAGKLRVDMRLVDLVSVITAALETVRPAAEAKGVALEAWLEPTATAVLGDPDRLQQVLWNLFSNAVKFTPRAGRVEVWLDRRGDTARIGVTDTGEGISPETLPFVFERFRQGDSSSTRSHGGLGLGLAIVRHLVELHGGTVEAESRGKGHGATFTVTLPLAAGAVEPDPDRDVGPRCDGIRVLVVEDDTDSREFFQAFLEQCGAEVTAVDSVREAMAALERGPVDIVVSDLAIPGEDGFALIRQLRGLPGDRGGRIPAVALSAHAGAETRTRALVAGYDTHVAKPVEPDDLAAVVARLGRQPPVGPAGERAPLPGELA